MITHQPTFIFALKAIVGCSFACIALLGGLGPELGLNFDAGTQTVAATVGVIAGMLVTHFK